MVEGIGCPEKLRAVAGHKSLKNSVRLVESCCNKAAKLDLDKWQDQALDTLKEIMCYCCHCHPDYLTVLREDSLLMISEVHRECLMDFTPSTLAYTKLCTLLQTVVMTTEAPIPYWAVSQRKSRRMHKAPAMDSLAALALHPLACESTVSQV